jgi:hypothetical protein
MAQDLLNGLGVGLQNAHVDWDAVLAASGMSAEVILAFKNALGIHSPSELTKALAPYLFDGLRAGIAEADATFETIELPGLQGKIAESFRTALTDGLKDGLDASEISKLHLNQKYTGEDFSINFTDLFANASYNEDGSVDYLGMRASWIDS